VKVLLCDDHQLFSEALATVLRRRGDAVVVTSAPEQALTAAVEQEPDVCLMDRRFGAGEDGIEAARALAAASPTTRVIMLTGHADPAGVRAAFEAGVRGFLLKDEGLAGILEAVDEVAAGSLTVDAELLRPVPVPGSPLLSRLTPREQEVLERIVAGESAHEMAAGLGVSYSTARTHTHSVLTKLGVRSRLQAAAFAVEHGLVRHPGLGSEDLADEAGT
jgi:two-component system nitrate/nitrite response regulator NarL